MTGAPTVTLFQGTLSADTNRLVISENPPSGTSDESGTNAASGASGASGGSGTRSESGTTTGSTTSTSSAQLTFTLKPADATITTSVHVDIYPYPSNTEATRVKRFDDVAGTGNTFATSWDGTDSEGYRVPDEDYQVIGTATYFASDGSCYSSIATHTVTVSGGSVSVKILNTDVRSDDPESVNLYSDTTADVDTVGHGTIGSRSDSATIRYEITGANVDDIPPDRRRVRLHIYKGDTNNKVKTIGNC